MTIIFLTLILEMIRECEDDDNNNNENGIGLDINEGDDNDIPPYREG